MPISGVHVLPVFGKGEHVASHVGSDQSVTDYATPEEADAWLWLAAHATGDRYMARVIHVQTSEANEHGRHVDHGRRDDVASEARVRFVDMITGWLRASDPDFIGPQCDSGQCDHDTCQRVYVIRDESATGAPLDLTDAEAAVVRDYGRGRSLAACASDHLTALASEAGRDLGRWRTDANEAWSRKRVRAIIDALDTSTETLAGIIEWGVPRKRRCGACEGCERTMERQRASRASRWSLAGCDAPVATVDWVTPSRALSRAIWRTAADPSLSTSSVYATRAPYLRKLAEEVATAERMNAQADTDVLRNVPEGAGDLIRLLTATLAITGDTVYSNRGLSPAARTVLTLAMGKSDTPDGARMALARARALWPRDANETRDARREARAEAARALADKRLRDLTDEHYDRLARLEARVDAMAPVVEALAPRVAPTRWQALAPARGASVASDDAVRAARRAQVTHARQVAALIALRARLDTEAARA